MGWISYHRAPGQTDIDHFTKDFVRSRQAVHAHGTVENVFYAAVERQSNPGAVDAIVYLMTRIPKADFNFAVKSMDETMLPVYAKAPQRVLNALTPTTDPMAQQWRGQCRHYHARRALIRSHLRVGDAIGFAHPIRFTNGTTLGRLTYTTSNRRVRLRDGSGQSYRVRHWRDLIVAIHKADGTTIELPSDYAIAA